MHIAIAGFGSIGRYLEDVFAPTHTLTPYDPPLGLGCDADLTDADYVFVCVPTPTLADGTTDLSAVQDVVLKSRPRVAVACQSTLPVGATDRLIALTGRDVVYVPEYAGESRAHPFRVQPRDFFIYGGYGQAAVAVRDLYASVFGEQARHCIVAPKTAEMAKYMENAFLALKVAFSNELYDLCSALGVPYADARELWTLDPRIGESHTSVTAERGFGGKCLPKDVAALCRQARDAGAPLSVLEAAASSNRRVRHAAALRATSSQA
jgi:UDPglucose 6-dehydrogenase